MAAAAVQPLEIGPSALAPHVEHQVFADFPAFQAHLQSSLPLWATQVSGDIENWTRGDTKTGPPWSLRCSTG